MAPKEVDNLLQEARARVIERLNDICLEYLDGEITAEEAVERMGLGDEVGYLYLRAYKDSGNQRSEFATSAKIEVAKMIILCYS